MSTLSIIFVGFGNVGQALAKLLERKQSLLEDQYDFNYRIVGIATGRHGMALNPLGLPMEQVLAALNTGESISRFHSGPEIRDTYDFIRFSEADVMFENSPVNYETGQPAANHIRTARQFGMHAITANKGRLSTHIKNLPSWLKRRVNGSCLNLLSWTAPPSSRSFAVLCRPSSYEASPGFSIPVPIYCWG